MDTRSLSAFLVSVPTCVETDSLICVWRVFQQSGSEQVVVVNAQRLPSGVLLLSKLPIAGLSPSLSSDFDSEPSLQTLLQRDPTLLLPLTLLPAHIPLEQIPPIDSLWGLVDAQGEFLGLVDRHRFLQSLLPSSVPLTHSLPHPLVDLLDRLPLPLMLQTAIGQVITQNLVWGQQVGELQNPIQVRQAAALVLEAAEPAGRVAAPLSQERSGLSNAKAREYEPSSVSVAHPHLAVQNSGMPLLESCQLSSEPNTCICTCLLKNGQSRVWQFTKIAIGYGLREELAMDRDSSLAPAFSIVPFRLATLAFQPDPAWQSLIQTESLWLVLAQDITEQQQVAKELAAKNADLVQLNRLKDEFLACISHELKTPLTAVLGLSSLLKDQALGTLNDRQSRYANLIHQSGRHLILIVNDILDLTRIETGQLTLNLDPINIETVCRRAYEQAGQLQAMEASAKAEGNATATDLQFSLDIEPPLSHLIADELRLRQMLSNLLCNAIKFTEVGGSIGLRVEDWEGWIAFTVWDTGIGIPADKQHLIFQKFQQLENPLTRRFDGTGLGLVLTQRLARLHGGDVTFTSVEGQGSEFTLLLPPRPPQAIATDPIAPQSVAGTANALLPSAALPLESAPVRITADNRLVMVVEAAPKAIESLSRQLTGLGYRVAIARTGTEALEKIRRLQPCAIFLNPLLPLLSGWDVLTLLKADATTRQIPVVVMAMRVEKGQAYQNGADGFLSLPIQSAVLEQSLEQLVKSPESETPDPLANLTVLHLRGQLLQSSPEAIVPTIDLNQQLYPHHCRILEVDDLEQADLLARVWKPDVVLLDGSFPDLQAVITQLSQLPFLAELPLVTLTPALTEAALEVPSLKVFPWIPNEASYPEAITLQQVIQLAVGIDWTPHILIADFTTLEADWTAIAHTNAGKTASATSGLQALVQYLHTAGFRSSVGSTWREVLRQLQHQSVDLLLFYVHTSRSHSLFAEMTQALEQLPVKPPVLVWHCHAYSADEPTAVEVAEFESLWGEAIATQVLPACLSMPELLAEISRLLPKKR
ncbi:response regulator [Phormidium tenue FACHB-886]|nr:response regulator [Phormidium tenue FACHB-886]